jgi:hypothetical protein
VRGTSKEEWVWNSDKTYEKECLDGMSRKGGMRQNKKWEKIFYI